MLMRLLMYGMEWCKVWGIHCRTGPQTEPLLLNPLSIGSLFRFGIDFKIWFITLKLVRVCCPFVACVDTLHLAFLNLRSPCFNFIFIFFFLTSSCLARLFGFLSLLPELYRLCPCTVRQEGWGHVRFPGETITGRMHLYNRVTEGEV